MGFAGIAGLALFMVSSGANSLCGAPPTAAEMSEAHAWAASLFTAKEQAFSFSYDGRPSAELLRDWTVTAEDMAKDKQRVERVVTFTDPQTRLEVRCVITEYNDSPAVDWVLTLHNAGDKDTPIIQDIRPLDWQVPWSKDAVAIHHSLGESNSAQSFAPVTKQLAAGASDALVLSAKGGRSSDGYMPFFNLEGKAQGMAIALGWSGQWEARFDYGTGPLLRVAAGMQTTHLLLHPGETIRTPRMLLVFWKNAADASLAPASETAPLRGNNLLRQVLMAHYLPRRNGDLVLAPICGSVGEADPDGGYEAPHLRAMLPLAKRGIEVFWSDMDPQQWYPGGFPNGTGTWEPDLAKYPNGLKPIGEAAHAAGLQYLLWFEPERVAKGSRIAKEHPDWVTGGENGGLFKLHLPEARAWITDYVDVQVRAAQLDWMRWDFNIEPLSYWRKNDAPDRQGMTEIRHIEGLYAMWDELCSRHPGMVIDLCASGGRRIDIESLSRGVPLWHSDMQCSGKPDPAADQLQNAALFRWVPMHAAGMFDLEPSYVFRSNMTTGNILGPLNDSKRLADPNPGPDDPAVRSVALYKKIRPYFTGDFYPLFPHDPAETVWYGYQFHRADLNEGMAVIFRREQCPEPNTIVHLNGLSAEKSYELRSEDAAEVRTLTGKELAALPLTAPNAPAAIILYYR